MCRIVLLMCAAGLAGLAAGCAGVSQSRYDALARRAHRLERQVQQAEDACHGAQRRCPPRARCRPAPRRVHRPGAARATAALARRLRRCKKRLQSTRRPLVLANHTREQNIGGGRRRATSVTLMPGTVILPLKGKRATRNKRARRAEERLRKSIAKRLATLADCYHRRMAQRRRPPRGAVSFAFEVTRTGRTRRVSVVHDLLRHGATSRCAVRVLKRLRLPRQRHTLWAVFPVEFHTGRTYPSTPPKPR